MTVTEFLDALEAKQLLSEKLLDKLRKKVASSTDKPLTAKSLARFLIEKGHLSKEEAVATLSSGGEISPPPEPEPSGTDQPPAEPSGVDMPMDQLQDLSSSAEWSIEESSTFAAPAGMAETGTATKKKKKKRGKKGNEWDSPLLLIGGGALVLMLIVGPLVAYIMFAENADYVLEEARQAMQEGSYGNAVRNYERFVENYPGNNEFSSARVELAMARIRRTLESGNMELAFEVAEQELRDIGDQPAFSEANDQLSDLLPRISRGLADQAEASNDPDQTNDLFEQASRALDMANNTRYIPKSRRDNNQLQGIRETLDRIERRQQSLADLEATFQAIDEAVAAGDSQAAYAEHEALIEKHPSLMEDQQLAEALQQISAAEQQNIQYVEDPLEAQPSEPESAVTATLAVANRRVPGTAPVEGTFCTQVDGVTYGLDTASGTVRWRRWTGPAISQSFPVRVADGFLLVEWRPADQGQPQQALLRVAADTGELQWRLELDDQLAAPVVAEDKVLLAGASGKLHVVDLETGTRRGYVQLPQPLRSPPVFDGQSGLAYLAGDRSSIYTISTSDFSCLGVYYTDHPRESIVAPPAVALDKLVFVVNDGAQTCSLHVHALEGNGAVGQQLAQQRLAGRVVQQPLVDGRRIVVITDRGQVAVYEASVGPDGEPLTELASRSARGSQPFVRYAALADGSIWLAENALTKYAVSSTGNRLTVEPLGNDYNRSDFVAPLEVRDGVVLHTRARRGRAGFAVTACRVADGEAFWQTDIAVPPAANPLASDSPTSLLLADANGQVFHFDPDSIRSRVQDQALSTAGDDEAAGDPRIFDHAALLADGAAVFAASGTPEARLYRPGGDGSLAPVRLPGALACGPTAFGPGWLAPLEVGQVFFLDSQRGEPLAAPFQPPLESGSDVAWQPATALEDGQALLTDSVSRVYLVEVSQASTPALVAVAESPITDTPVASSFAVAGRLAMAATGDGRLVTVQLPTLDAGAAVNLDAPVVWGPHAVGGVVVVQTAGDMLMAVDEQGEVVWRVPTPAPHPVGPPLLAGESMVVATEEGAVIRIALSDGSEAVRRDLGQPLASGPAQLGNRLVVAARDSALLVFESP